MYPPKIVLRDGELIVSSPIDRQEVGRVRVTPAEAVPAMVVRARQAQCAWGALPVGERARRLRPAADRLHDCIDSYVDLIARECGKPRMEAMSSEVFPVIAHINYLCTRAPRWLRPEPLPDFWITRALGKRGRISWQPYGLVAVISPWNYPFWLAAAPVLAALIAGNAVIVKPSEFTPLSGDLVRQLLETLDLPGGVFQMAHGDGRVGAAIADAGVDKIIFTGSTATGRKILVSAAQHLTPVTMELGGKDAAIVLPDADLDLAARGIAWGAFTCSGQVCASIERVYAHAAVADELTRRMAAHVQTLRSGDDIGSMNNERQHAIVTRQLGEALKRGVKPVTGGDDGSHDDSLHIRPTILRDVPEDCELMQAETFGPIVPVQTVASVDEAIARANASPFGLSASIWTRDTARAEQIAHRLNVGAVSVNDHLSLAGLPDVPWGGVKDSGFGRLQGRQGLMEMVWPQVIMRDVVPLKRPWWYHYDEHTFELFRNLAALLTNKPWSQKLRAVAGALRHFRLRRLL